jgi:hypothetical protein
MDLKDTGWNGVDWIHLAEEMDQWHVHSDQPSIKGRKVQLNNC